MNSTYDILNVILVKSEFERKPTVSIVAGTDFIHEAKITTRQLNGDNDSQINLSMDLEMFYPNQTNFEIKVKVEMVGLFRYQSVDSLGEEKSETRSEFINLKGPQILLPFIREHVANLTLKAGLPPVFLPPLTFTLSDTDISNMFSA